MSRTRLLLAAAVALLLVTGAFFVATAPWGLPRLLCPSAPETVPVVVAAQDIPPYAVLTADMIKTRDLPRDLVPPGTLTKVEDALDRAVLTPLVKGEILLGNKLAPKGAGRGMAARLPKE